MGRILHFTTAILPNTRRRVKTYDVFALMQSSAVAHLLSVVLSFSFFWLKGIILTRIRARSCLFEDAYVFSRALHHSRCLRIFWTFVLIFVCSVQRNSVNFRGRKQILETFRQMLLDFIEFSQLQRCWWECNYECMFQISDDEICRSFAETCCKFAKKTAKYRDPLFFQIVVN